MVGLREVHNMRILISTLLIAVLLIGPLAARVLTSTNVTGPDCPVVVADDPDPLLEGIDWDEWFDNLLEGIDWDEWFDNMLEGIDWDEWLESIGVTEDPTVA